MENYNPYQTPRSGLNLEVQQASDYDTSPVYSPRGRMGRLSYFAWTALAYIGFLLLVFVTAAVMAGAASVIPADEGAIGTFLPIFLVSLLPALVLMVIFGIRRLHDMDRSGWQLLLFIVPIANIYISLLLLLQPGTEGENRFGPARFTPTWEQVVGWLWVGLNVLLVVLWIVEKA